MESWLLAEPRRAGMLLHPTSLPGPGIGDLGPAAIRWLDWLEAAGQTVWQILPLVPVGGGGSPYDGLSAFAGNDLLVSPERLAEERLLDADVLERDAPPQASRFDVAEVTAWKERILHRAYDAFCDGRSDLEASFEAFRSEHAHWVEDYALFRVLRSRFGDVSWVSWPAPVRRREENELGRLRAEHASEVERHVFRQFLFERQWTAVRLEAESRGIRIMGDVPIFVSHDSADVWAAQELFRLDADGRPRVVAGVPPDAFSATGQRWGNPIPDWGRMEEKGFPWWRRRIERIMQHVHIARIDHFRGFEAYWEIPADEPTAVNGHWTPGPGERLFHVLEQSLGPVPLVAEDLGLITDEVHELRERLGLPGMRVIQFGFDGDPHNLHHPRNIPENSVAYTGTHDNDTIVGWYRDGIGVKTRARVERSVGMDDEVHRRLLSAVWETRARYAIAPLQDVLGLGNEAKMNTPGTSSGNWNWRLPEDPPADQAGRLRDLTETAGRLAGDAKGGT